MKLREFHLNHNLQLFKTLKLNSMTIKQALIVTEGEDDSGENKDLKDLLTLQLNMNSSLLIPLWFVLSFSSFF
jgi:hypothetical protein